MSFDSQFASLAQSQLDNGSPTPLYFQLYSLLKKNILNGSLEDGSQLPTELNLSETFNISRITAKRALDELAADGLVARRRAKGTHVTHQYQPNPIKAPLVGMLQELEFMGQHSDAKVIELLNTRPPANIAKEFDLGEGETLLKMTRVRSRQHEAFGYYSSWSKGLHKLNDKASIESLTRLEIFRENGIEIKHVKQILSASAATPEVAKELGVDVGFPLLNLTRQSYDENENLVDYLNALYHPDRFQYRMDLTPDSAG
ncbi:MAG: GntR family transcriptional regulator [Paraglaciecola sp.]|uniref:GntR family transcriptional regulator n=1 Tax=Paraglaciecola sp. TaxID=1920173 RepID=UPI0032986687